MEVVFGFGFAFSLGALFRFALFIFFVLGMKETGQNSTLDASVSAFLAWSAKAKRAQEGAEREDLKQACACGASSSSNPAIIELAPRRPPSAAAHHAVIFARSFWAEQDAPALHLRNGLGREASGREKEKKKERR